MRVNLADINMSTDAGAKTALARIRWSAGAFCEANAGRESLARDAAVSRCVSDMTHRSVAQLNAPLVTALLEGRSATAVALAQK